MGVSRDPSSIHAAPKSAITAPWGTLVTPRPREERQCPSSLHAVDACYPTTEAKLAEKTPQLLARPGGVHIAVAERQLG